MSSKDAFTFGIEEEYFLVSLSSGALVGDPPAGMLERCKSELGKQFASEYQRSQIEVATKVCETMADARADLARLRSAIAAIANEHGLAPMAASTHPFTPWSTQRHTDKQRYRAIADDLKGLGKRMVVGGMHVHVGIEDREQRIGVMNDIRAFLPLLLALSTSSPFWQGENTGLKSYRTAVNDTTPRSGIPERFESWNDYCATLAPLVRSGVIEDGTKIWWDLRPSARFPTLELRITDICPLIDDALCIAALFRCLCRHLCRRQREGLQKFNWPLLLLNENRWRAQRYGLQRGFVSLGRDDLVSSADPARGIARSDWRGRGVLRQPGRGRSCSRHSCARHERRPSNCTLSARGRTRRGAPRRAKERSERARRRDGRQPTTKRIGGPCASSWVEPALGQCRLVPGPHGLLGSRC